MSSVLPADPRAVLVDGGSMEQSVRWDVRGDEVWLTVDAQGARVEDLVREADTAGYTDLDMDALAAAVADPTPRLVGRAPSTDTPGRLTVTVADDALSATLHVTPPRGSAPRLTLEDVEAALAAADVRLGVDHLLLGSIPLHEPGEYLVASGWAPTAGLDGHLEYALTANHEMRPQARGDGGVDFRAVATIPDVRAGQLLAVLVEPAPGTPGRTVRGEPIPAPAGVPASLPRGENVVVSDDGRRLYAALDGLLEIADGQIAVRPDFVVPGDVDFESGSISFRGDVIVRGSVRPGFRVEAGGRLVVYGDVEQAEVAAHGFVWVRGAVAGQQSLVRCDGDVKVRTLHEGRIEARGSVFVEREANDGTILAAHDLVFERSRNRLAGGQAWVGRQVLAGEIGSVAEEATRVEVGTDPFTAEVASELRTESSEHARMLERMETAVGPFRDKPEVVAALDERRAEAIRRLFTVEASLRARLAEIDERLAELAPTEDGSRPRVVARQVLRPGVVVTVRGARLRVRRTEFRVSAVNLGGHVTMVPVGSEPIPTPGPIPPAS